MADLPILFVAGFGRCGTTMMMTMLDRGGLPCAGPRPDYEVDQMAPGGPDLEWVRAQSGKAVKWISPLYTPIRPADLEHISATTIYMQRDFREMAASQVKLLGSRIVVNPRHARRVMAANMQKEAPAQEAMLNKLCPVYHFTFEWVLAHPQDAAQKIAAIVLHEFGIGFDAEAAARVPLHRDPRCAPDLSIEARLLGGVR